MSGTSPRRVITRRIRSAASLLVLLIAAACASSGSGDSGEVTEPEYVAGETYFGTNDYIEYVVGDLPVVISAPHGGYVAPEDIPDRTYGTMVQDLKTQELARKMREELQVRTGGTPHLIICHLRRRKLDANRDITVGAQGDPQAMTAWNEWHSFINVAKDRVEEDFGQGLYIDLHGHGHDIDRLELGYLLSDADLALSDEELNDPACIDKSSMRTMVEVSDSTFASIIRGPASFGTLIQDLGFPAVPGSQQPSPGPFDYFSGGYNTAVHGSRNANSYVNGVQIECNYDGVRDSAANREAFSEAVAEALELFFAAHFDVPLAPGVAAAGGRGTGVFSLVGPEPGPGGP